MTTRSTTKHHSLNRRITSKFTTERAAIKSAAIYSAAASGLSLSHRKFQFYQYGDLFYE